MRRTYPGEAQEWPEKHQTWYSYRKPQYL
jgi:hypothetical protein